MVFSISQYVTPPTNLIIFLGGVEEISPNCFLHILLSLANVNDGAGK